MRTCLESSNRWRGAQNAGPHPPTTASGGPGTFAGTNYQCDFAVLTTLRLIRTALSTGAADARITLEPRLIGNNDTITAWDAKIEPESECFEAKSNLTAADVSSWLKLVAVATAENPTHKFTLISGDGRPLILRSLDRLCRDAAAAGDPAEFSRLARDVGLSGAADILSIFSSNAYTALRRIHLETWARDAIGEMIAVESDSLACPQKALDLRSFLFERISRCAARRLTINIDEPVAELEKERGIRLTVPPISKLAGSANQRGQS